jgi:hypothetical protein
LAAQRSRQPGERPPPSTNVFTSGGVFGDARCEDLTVERRVRCWTRRRPLKWIVGCSRCLAAGDARWRVDPTQGRGQVSVLDRTLARGPMLCQHLGGGEQQRRPRMLGLFGQKRQPPTEDRHGYLDGIRPNG